MAQSVASGLYSSTFGYLFGSSTPAANTAADEDDGTEAPGMSDEEYICVDYLERQCDIFHRWAIKSQLTLMTRAKAKLCLQNQTKHTLEDIELLLKHLEHSGRIAVGNINSKTEASDDNLLLKFINPNDSESEQSIS